MLKLPESIDYLDVMSPCSVSAQVDVLRTVVFSLSITGIQALEGTPALYPTISA